MVTSVFCGISFFSKRLHPSFPLASPIPLVNGVFSRPSLNRGLTFFSISDAFAPLFMRRLAPRQASLPVHGSSPSHARCPFVPGVLFLPPLLTLNFPSIFFSFLGSFLICGKHGGVVGRCPLSGSLLTDTRLFQIDVFGIIHFFSFWTLPFSRFPHILFCS